MIKTFGEFINESFNTPKDVENIYKELVKFYTPIKKGLEITLEDSSDGKWIKIPITFNGDYVVTEPDVHNPSEIFCVDIPKKFEKLVNTEFCPFKYDVEDLGEDQLPENSEPMCRLLLKDNLEFDDIIDIVNKIRNLNKESSAIYGPTYIVHWNNE